MFHSVEHNGSLGMVTRGHINLHGGNYLEVQWFGRHASTAGGTGSIPGWGTKIPHAAQRGQNVLKEVLNGQRA